MIYLHSPPPCVRACYFVLILPFALSRTLTSTRTSVLGPSLTYLSLRVHWRANI